MYKDKKRCAKAMLKPDRYDLYVKICKELNISKVEQTTNLVNCFIDNYPKHAKKHIK
jgi:hypothetical protein